jgi:hypothetical protein
MVTALLAAAALAGAPASACPATTVQYQPAKHPTLEDTPWVLASPQAPAIIGFLVDYPASLRDRRVNRSDGLVLWTQGARIVWTANGMLTARRIDGRGAFRVSLVQSPDGPVAEPRFPSSGCWRLTLRADRGTASVVARVVSRPKALRCAATVLGLSGFAFARPRSSGIRGGWPWQTTGPATLYTHGHAGDRNMKVPWFVTKDWGPTLELFGTRLDAAGSFKQEFPMAISPRGVFPSIVDVPAAGCWLFRLRTARLAGVLVVRAIDYHG